MGTARTIAGLTDSTVRVFGRFTNHASTPRSRGRHGAWGGRGWWLIGYGATGNSGKGVRTLALASALTGTISGAGLGRSLTDAEAHSAWGGIQTGAATAWSATTAAGFSSRSTAVAIVGGEAIGYAIGVHYPRRAGYTVTAGDVDAVQTAGLIGALTSAAFFGSNNHPSRRQFAATMEPGYLAGIMIGDLAISRPLDLTTSDATLGNVGSRGGWAHRPRADGGDPCRDAT